MWIWLIGLGCFIGVVWVGVWLSLRQEWLRAPERTPVEFSMLSRPGTLNTIEWFDVDRLRVVGWCEPKPQVGDVILSPMRSGKIGRFEVDRVDLPGDPHDMFFATVRPIGYVLPEVN